MGALAMEIMNKTLIENQKQVEKLTKQLEKAKEEKKTKKEYERGLKEAIENDLIDTMKWYFENEPFQNACINLKLTSTRNEILKNVAENEIEARWVDKNYERIFNKVKKIYENDMKAKQEIKLILDKKEALEQEETELKEQLQQLKEAEQDAKFENGIKIFFNIIKWIFIIIFAPIVLLFIFIYMCAKDR